MRNVRSRILFKFYWKLSFFGITLTQYFIFSTSLNLTLNYFFKRSHLTQFQIVRFNEFPKKKEKKKNNQYNRIIPEYENPTVCEL